MYEYYYLAYSLVFLVILLMICLWRRDLRKLVLWTALIGAVFGPLAELFHFQDYWQPYSIAGQGKISIEDVIFGASICGISVVLCPLILRRGISSGSPPVPRRMLVKRGTFVLAAPTIMAVVLFLAGINSVIAVSIACTIAWVFICTKRRDLFWPSMLAGLVLTGFATSLYGIGLNFVATDALESIWLLSGSALGATFLGQIPLTEIIWFLSVGWFISAIFLFISEKRLVKKPSAPAQIQSVGKIPITR